MSVQSSSVLAKRKSCTSLITLSMTYTGYILFMGSFSQSNVA